MRKVRVDQRLQGLSHEPRLTVGETRVPAWKKQQKTIQDLQRDLNTQKQANAQIKKELKDARELLVSAEAAADRHIAELGSEVSVLSKQLSRDEGRLGQETRTAERLLEKAQSVLDETSRKLQAPEKVEPPPYGPSEDARAVIALACRLLEVNDVFGFCSEKVSF